MTELKVEGLEMRGGRDAILVTGASFTLASGELVAVLGPNGAGKTSLLRGALGLERASAGQSLLDGRDTAALPPRDRARAVAYLPQQRPLAWPSPVRDVVALGRFSHGATLGRLGAMDRAAVDRAMKACGLEPLAARACSTLSGGELARVHCARAFAAEAPLLVADEPVASLDPNHRFRIMDLLRRFVDDGGGALVVIHDIELAARYADRLIWMKEGRIVASGPTAETLSAERLEEIFSVRARVDGHRVELERAL
ncbi:MAG: ABC transporter ATP-binding protein [Pseudomonadota bacterium]